MARDIRSKLKRSALESWGFHGNGRYRKPLADYNDLLAKKREVEVEINMVSSSETKICLPIHGAPKIKKETIQDYPKIPFLDLPTEEKAKAALEKMTDSQLLNLIDDLEFEKMSYSYKNIRLWNKVVRKSIQVYKEKSARKKANPSSYFSYMNCPFGEHVCSCKLPRNNKTGGTRKYHYPD